jgi:hypothetical protein
VLTSMMDLALEMKRIGQCESDALQLKLDALACEASLAATEASFIE